MQDTLDTPWPPAAWRVRGTPSSIPAELRNQSPITSNFCSTSTRPPRPPSFRFQEILSEVGFNGGQPIDEAFFRARISGRHNPEIAADLFPEWSVERHVAFYTDKEQRFRDLAGGAWGKARYTACKQQAAGAQEQQTAGYHMYPKPSPSPSTS